MYFHVWFSTKYRKCLLCGEIEKLILDSFEECIARHGYRVLELAANRDHVHVLLEVCDRKELAGAVRTLKAVSARQVLCLPDLRKRNFKHFWARRYGWNAIPEPRIETVRAYIRAQGNVLYKKGVV